MVQHIFAAALYATKIAHANEHHAHYSFERCSAQHSDVCHNRAAGHVAAQLRCEGLLPHLSAAALEGHAGCCPAEEDWLDCQVRWQM